MPPASIFLGTSTHGFSAKRKSSNGCLAASVVRTMPHVGIKKYALQLMHLACCVTRKPFNSTLACTAANIETKSLSCKKKRRNFQRKLGTYYTACVCAYNK